MLRLICSLLLLLQAGISYAQVPRETPEQRKALSLDSFVYNITQSIFTVVPQHTQFAYCVIQNGKSHYFGFQKELETVKKISNKDSVFELGSLTKLFTALLFSDLVSKGQLNTNDKLGSFFDQSLKAGNEKTLLSLVNHTSGLPRIPDDLGEGILNPYKDYDYKKLENYLQHQLKVADTVAYDYSNLGYAVLEYIIAKKSGIAFEKHLQTFCLEDLGMHHTSTQIEKIKPYLVQGRDSAGLPTENWEMNAFVGAGGLYSNVSDLEKWIQHYFEGKDPVFSQTLDSTFEVSPQFNLAWAWHYLKNANGDIMYLHNGGTNGYGCTILMDTKKKNAVILLTNLSAFHPYFSYIDKAAANIMRKMDRDSK